MKNLDKLISKDYCQISRKVFTSEEVYQQEKQHIFGKSWIYLGHESQIPEEGDYVLAYIAETSIILSRGSKQSIHASVNSCTHRGLPVARHDRGNAKRLICPYHAWSYDIEGNLSAIPQEKELEKVINKDQLGLKKLPRIETYCGLIFASLNENIEPLEKYLGDMRWYIDCMFDRSAGGAEVIGTPHKWLLDCNWKLPVENQLGDVAHGPYLHGALLKDTPQVQEIIDTGYNVVPKAGHGVSVRLMQENASPEQCIAGMDGFTAFDPETKEYFLEQHKEAEERLGKIRSRIRPLCYSIYPNLSFLWGNSTLRISHPRGPAKTEYWSWWVVDKNIPEGIKNKLQKNYNFFFGPGGFLEQEDSEAWTQQYKGSNIDFVDDQFLYYGLGLGEEKKHKDLPGLSGSIFNEFYARAFYQRWKNEIQSEKTQQTD
jgi:phenylpropionate dioxygenase-like ring-hydroxylating dioxygenase large terminal subunit